MLPIIKQFIDNNANYHFVSETRVKARIEEVWQILRDPSELPRWWSSVYLDVQVTEQGAENALGQRVSLFTKGFLPYTLRWDFVVTDVLENNKLRLDAVGDFVGRGIGTLEQDGDEVLLRYDWKVRAEKPLLKYFSFALRPIFSANHEWAMEMGKKSLELELARLRAKNTLELEAVPEPPPATPSNLVAFLLMFLAGKAEME